MMARIGQLIDSKLNQSNSDLKKLSEELKGAMRPLKEDNDRLRKGLHFVMNGGDPKELEA